MSIEQINQLPTDSDYSEVDLSKDKRGVFVGPQVIVRAHLYHSYNELRINEALATVAQHFNASGDEKRGILDAQEFQQVLNSVLKPFGFEIRPIEQDRQPQETLPVE